MRDFTFITLAGLVAAFTACGAPDAPTVAWHVGSQYAYRFSVSSQAEIGSGAPAVTLELSGELVVRPTRVAGAVVELETSVRGLHLESSDPQGHAPLERELALPARLSLERGRVSAVWAPKDAQVATVAIQRTLASALQFAPDGASPEFDASGGYDAAYVAQATAGRFSREKRAYRALQVTSGVPGLGLDLTPRVVASSGEVRVGGGRLAAASSQDELAVELGGAVRMHSSTRWSIELVSESPAPGATSASEGLERLAAGTPYAGPAPKLELDDARTRGQSYARLVAQLERAHAPGEDGSARRAEDLQAFATLVALLRGSPAEVAETLARLRAGTPAAAALRDALASSGTPEAQAALVTLYQGAAELSGRAAVLSSLVRTAAPTEATVQVFVGLLGEPPMRLYALYGLGSFARRLREAGAVARSDALSGRLLGELKAARDPEEQARVLRGLSNAGSVALVAVAPAYLGADDVAVRLAAVEALRLVPGDAADALLAGALAHDAAASARLAVLDSLATRSPGAALIAQVARAAQGDADAHVRQRAVDLLASWQARHPEVRTTLTAVARTDPQPKIRDSAAASLAR